MVCNGSLYVVFVSFGDVMIKSILFKFVNIFNWPRLIMDGTIELHLINNPFYKGDMRNQICVCGSGKKMKSCHGKHPRITIPEATEIYEMATKQMREKREALCNTQIKN